ncbi:hypothetical protein [Demequina litorisediminis]|uniref:hypothetical protein n=1 Tax=Demequina litorisediminis TaxID=1849022 RepID=UPI0024E17C88|nr:hypothetical protein [Demequina litorisediminis]
MSSTTMSLRKADGGQSPPAAGIGGGVHGGPFVEGRAPARVADAGGAVRGGAGWAMACPAGGPWWAVGDGGRSLWNFLAVR